MFHYNYWCEIEFAEGEIILDLITDAICTAWSIGASFCRWLKSQQKFRPKDLERDFKNVESVEYKYITTALKTHYHFKKGSHLFFVLFFILTTSRGTMWMHSGEVWVTPQGKLEGCTVISMLFIMRNHTTNYLTLQSTDCRDSRQDFNSRT